MRRYPLIFGPEINPVPVACLVMLGIKYHPATDLGS